MIKNLSKVAAALKTGDDFLIVCHIDPDGDTIGSALALKYLLQKLGKQVTVFSKDRIPSIYDFLPGVASIKKSLPKQRRFNTLISVDAGAEKRVSDGKHTLCCANKIINIDHHPDNTYFGDLNLVDHVSCAAELVFLLAKHLKIKIDVKMATNLYVAMMTDTGNFKYSNTTANTFGIAKELVEAGASPSESAIYVYEEKPLSAVAIHAHAALNAHTARHGKVIWTLVKHSTMKKISATEEDLNGIVDSLRAVKGVEVAMLIREHGKAKVKVNFRSKRKVNVQKIARSLGGGGHIRSSGAIVSGNIKEAEKKVLKAVFQHVK